MHFRDGDPSRKGLSLSGGSADTTAELYYHRSQLVYYRESRLTRSVPWGPLWMWPHVSCLPELQLLSAAAGVLMILTAFLPFGAVGSTTWEADRGLLLAISTPSSSSLLPPHADAHWEWLHMAGGRCSTGGAAALHVLLGGLGWLQPFIDRGLMLPRHRQ